MSAKLCKKVAQLLQPRNSLFGHIKLELQLTFRHYFARYAGYNGLVLYVVYIYLVTEGKGR